MLWEVLGAGGEGDDRGWDGWMASLTRWTWVWVNSESWWWTGRPGVLRFMGSQRVRHDWATELNSCCGRCWGLYCRARMVWGLGEGVLRRNVWREIIVWQTQKEAWSNESLGVDKETGPSFNSQVFIEYFLCARHYVRGIQWEAKEFLSSWDWPSSSSM